MDWNSQEMSLQLMKPLAAKGLTGHVINILDPNWPARLAPIVVDGILTAWGMTGYGSDISEGKKSLWDILHVPFVSVLSDNPCAVPAQHQSKSRFVALGYAMEEWLDIQRRFIRSPRLCGLLPSCVPPNPYHNWVPWERRKHRMIFVKSGDSP